MSAVCLLNFNSKHLTFEQLNNLANDMVKNALLNGIAVYFNDNIVEELLSDEKSNTSVILSDSFLYRNADDLLDFTNFAYETEENYKTIFIQKYSFLSQLIDIVLGYKIESIDLYISEQGNFDNYIYVETKKENAVYELFNTFMEHSLKTGYTFPDLKIHIIR